MSYSRYDSSNREPNQDELGIGFSICNAQEIDASNLVGGHLRVRRNKENWGPALNYIIV